MGACDCQEVIWKWKAMRLVMFTVTQLTFTPFHFSFNELFNFTCVVPYRWCSYTACPFYLSHLETSSLGKKLVHFSKSVFKKDTFVIFNQETCGCVPKRTKFKH